MDAFTRPLATRREVIITPHVADHSRYLIVCVHLHPNGTSNSHRAHTRPARSASLRRLLHVIFDAEVRGDCTVRPAMSCVGYIAYFTT